MDEVEFLIDLYWGEIDYLSEVLVQEFKKDKNPVRVNHKLWDIDELDNVVAFQMLHQKEEKVCDEEGDDYTMTIAFKFIFLHCRKIRRCLFRRINASFIRFLLFFGSFLGFVFVFALDNVFIFFTLFFVSVRSKKLMRKMSWFKALFVDEKFSIVEQKCQTRAPLAMEIDASRVSCSIWTCSKQDP